MTSLPAEAPTVHVPAVPRRAGVGGIVAVSASIGLVLVARLTSVGQNDRLQEFVLVFASIVVEALPFILVGALVSALIAVFVSDRAFERVARLPTAVQIPGAMACALAFPVCECGSVPVARRLISRGISPAAGVAFMLAAPVVNPVVLGATWIAYGGSGNALEMTAGRALVALCVAATAGVVLSRVAFVAPADVHDDGHHHDHRHHGGRLHAVADHLAGDFLFMGKFVVLGAAVAAVLQTAVPRDALESLGGTAVIAPLALMALAIMLSLCSEADAFVAVSFSGFAPGAQLAFLALGPVIDTKLAVLYAGTFRRRFVPVLLVVAIPIILLASFIFDGIVG
jgi:uncharacterized membrane protein YraQ (UPF0718 family)